MILFFSMSRRTTRNRCSVFFVSVTAMCMQVMWVVLVLLFQTNFNTVLTREKMRKENIINDLSDKLKSTMQQQERDKGEWASGVQHLWLWWMRTVGNCPLPRLQIWSSPYLRTVPVCWKRRSDWKRRLAGCGAVPSCPPRAWLQPQSCTGPVLLSPRWRPWTPLVRGGQTQPWRLARCLSSECPVLLFRHGQPALRVGGLGSPSGDSSPQTRELDPVDWL